MSSVSKKSGTNAFVLMLSKVITLFLSMMTSMILARTLDLDEYGTYSELLTVSSIAVSIFSLGLPNALNYFLPRCKDENEKRKFINFYFLLITVLSLVLMCVMGLVNKPIAAYYHNTRLITYSYFLILVPWTKLVISSRSNLLVAEGMVTREMIYCVLNGVFLSLISVLTIFNRSNFDIYIVSYVLIEGVFAIMVYFEAFWLSGKKFHFEITTSRIKELLIFTIPLGLSTAISTISLDLDKMVIGYVMDEASVAIYANAGKELPFSLISTSFTAVFLPKIVLWVKNKQTTVAISCWKDIMEINYIILSFCVAASIVFAPQIISLLYSEVYLGGVNIFRIYSLTLLLRITYWAMFLNAFGRTQEILYNSIICLILNIILNFVFYYIIGFAGPAIATLLSILSIVILQIKRTSNLLKMPVCSFIPFKKFLFPTAVCLLSGMFMSVTISMLNIGTDTKGILFAVALGIVWGGGYLMVFDKKILTLWKSLNCDVSEKI